MDLRVDLIPFQSSFSSVQIKNEAEVESEAEIGTGTKPLATEIVQIACDCPDYPNGLQSPQPSTKYPKKSPKMKKKKQKKKSENVNPLESNEDEATAVQYGTQHKCPVCNRCFSSGWNLREHIERHSDDRPYECWLCHKA